MTPSTPTPEDASRRGLSRRLRLTIAGLVLARGLVGLCITPLFEGWDEYQHVAYIVHIQETGRRAVLKQDLVPASMLAAMQGDLPQPEAARVQFPNILKPSSYESYWRLGLDRPDSRPRRLAASEIPPHDLKMYQAQHSWWYYVLVSPLFRVLGGVDDLRSSVTGLRLLNLACIVGAVWIALGVVSRRVRDRRTAGWIALMIGVQPLFVMNGIRVSSDAPGVFFAVAAVAGMMTLAIDERRIIRQACRVGVLVALAILMKSTNLALLPALGATWMLAMVRVRPTPRVALTSAAAIGGIVGGLLAPDLIHNFSTYGIATPMQEAIENRAKGRGFRELYQAFREFSPVVWGRWLFGEGLFIQGNWSFVLPIREITRVHWQAVEWAVLGLSFPAAALVFRRLAARIRKRPLEGLGGIAPGFDSLATPLLCLVVCAGFYAALLYHALQSAMAWGETTTGPWYASPAIPWFLLLVGVGASGWHRFVAPGLVAAIVLLSVAAEQTSWWIQMLPVYSGGAFGWAAIGRMASLQVWYLSTTTCLAAMAAGLALFATAVRSISLAADGVESQISRPTWFSIGRARERIDASTTGVPAPAGRRLVPTEPASLENGDREVPEGWR